MEIVRCHRCGMSAQWHYITRHRTRNGFRYRARCPITEHRPYRWGATGRRVSLGDFVTGQPRAEYASGCPETHTFDRDTLAAIYAAVREYAA